MEFKVLFAIVAYFDLNINQIDEKTVFFYKLINQLVYVNIPKSFESEATQNNIYKLLKAFYELKQSPRLWYKKFLDFSSKNSG